jgi:hypothetical protein
MLLYFHTKLTLSIEDCFVQRNKNHYGGNIGAVDGLYYMSSPNVVFVCKAGRMFYTVK